MLLFVLFDFFNNPIIQFNGFLHRAIELTRSSMHVASTVKVA